MNIGEETPILDDFESVLERFRNAANKAAELESAPVEPELPQVVWRVVWTERPGAMRVDFLMYCAYTKQEAERFGNERYGAKPCWRIDYKPIKRQPPVTYGEE